MTERWKLELVEAIKEIADNLPELTKEIRRFNNRCETDISEGETESDTQHSNFGQDI